ncbi:MAG: prephenate dehydratase [Deltaproteobacteria bacterium]|nr:prephenate dehydratase [Deltaproteobacteria bacterium]MBW1962766.1 prephenate dehydratase [Deltaproteobacteria bacterium]MBW2153539.1 prephenate dehydratase [Deltaproteobacteria bacterium]
MKQQNDINEIRAAIDGIDRQILNLINQRLEYAKAIGKAKALQGEQVLDPARESRLIRRLSEMNRGPLSERALHHIYTEIIAASREIQSPQKVAYLGPEATFTHLAAINHFGRSVSFSPQPSIQDTFQEVEKGSFDFGVVPVENTIEGAVNYTLDLFYESNLKICAEIYLPISHDLLSNAGSYDAIRIIYSHPHAFAQCRQWLRKHLPNCMLVDCNSTAEAARQAADEPKTAAIASREAARIYNLEVLASRIEDRSRNITRFLVIGKNEVRATGADKTSILFVTAHVPGALYKVLTPIAEAGVNLLKLESRPSKYENWSYVFFLDMEGHISEPFVRQTLEKMKQLCLFLKYLGSYPRAAEGTQG